jgi:hypothetical protein
MPTNMGGDYNSAGADEGQFDKTRWSISCSCPSRIPVSLLRVALGPQLRAIVIPG